MSYFQDSYGRNENSLAHQRDLANSLLTLSFKTFLLPLK